MIRKLRLFSHLLLLHKKKPSWKGLHSLIKEKHCDIIAKYAFIQYAVTQKLHTTMRQHIHKSTHWEQVGSFQALAWIICKLQPSFIFASTRPTPLIVLIYSLIQIKNDTLRQSKHQKTLKDLRGKGPKQEFIKNNNTLLVLKQIQHTPKIHFVFLTFIYLSQCHSFKLHFFWFA